MDFMVWDGGNLFDIWEWLGDNFVVESLADDTLVITSFDKERQKYVSLNRYVVRSGDFVISLTHNQLSRHGADHLGYLLCKL